MREELGDGVTTSTIVPETVELESHYEISYRTGSYRIVDGYHLAELIQTHRLPGGLPVHKIGAPA